MTTQTNTSIAPADRSGIMKHTRFIVIAAAAVSVFLGSLFLTTGKSEAFTVPAGSDFRTPATAPSKIWGQASWLGGDYLEFAPFTANRSAARLYATQRICAEIRVYSTGVSRDWTHNPSYTDLRCATVAPGGGYVNFDRYFRQVTGGRNYTVQILFTWQVNGQFIGWRLVDYNQVGDYGCNPYVPNNLCSVTNGWLGRGAVGLDL